MKNIPFITAEEAAAFISNGETLGMAGFTPAGSPKCIPLALAHRAEAEHAAGRPFKINMLTGASTGHSCDEALAEADAIGFRAPYASDSVFRAKANSNQLAYTDLNLSNMATQMRQGFLGHVDWAVIEACEVEEAGENLRVYLTCSVGVSPTVCRLARKGVFIEVNQYHAGKLVGLHDIYELQDHPFRTPVPITKPTDRIGKPYIEIPVCRVKGMVYTNQPDEARPFTEPNEVTNRIGQNVADFLLKNLREGLIPSTFLNLQSGVGSGANAVLHALGSCSEVPDFSLFTEVLQDAPIHLMLEGRIKSASTCALAVTDSALQTVYSHIDFFKERVVLRPSEISNNPEVIARIGVCSLNTAIEVDIYGHVNSTKICGTKIMNGIGGSADFTNNAYLSIFTCGSTAKGGKISSIVPFCSHVDHTSHFVDAVITEYGVADLRGKCAMDKAAELVKVAHPDYRPMLTEYLDRAAAGGGHAHHVLSAAFAMHDTFNRKGDMRLTDWSEYIK